MSSRKEDASLLSQVVPINPCKPFTQAMHDCTAYPFFPSIDSRECDCHNHPSFRGRRPRRQHFRLGLGSDTNCNGCLFGPTTIPQANTRLNRRALSSLAHRPKNFPGGHPSSSFSKSSTLNFGVPIERATEKKMHLC